MPNSRTDALTHSRTAVLEYLGRLDHQVKVRGFRIELGEIEAALRRHASVADCVVMARADAGEQRLVAYVVGGVEAVELRAHLRQSLPEYMVPAAFVFMDALPLTPNGKLDRKALPAPELASAEERYVAPRTPVEEVLAGIWAEVLRLERVGVEESFFDLGGHSLLATRVVSRVRELFGVELPLRALFEGPTVAELAGRVEEMRRAGLPVLPAVVPIERTGALPLSFAQERLWFLDRLEPGSTTYNVPVAWRLGGALDQAALERALGEIVRRHETLRTVFAEADGSPVQVIAPFGGFALPVEDLSGLSEADREAAVRQRAEEEARRAFDLSAGPLFRATLLRADVEDHVLLLSMHHVVSDGWSMGVLRRELSALYAAYREGGESSLPELAVQYADYAAWQREQLAGEALDRQLAYWRERLAGAPELLELPTDYLRPAVRSFRGASERIELSGELLERLRALGRSEGATLYMVVLAAFQVLLSRYSGSEDIVVGSPIAGRTRREVEELIGFFVNTLVLRTDLGGNPGFREVLGRVREVTLGAYEHQELPFEKLVAELQPERSLGHSPLFQVVFSLQNRDQPVDGLAGLETETVEAELATTKFDLALGLAAHPQGLRGVLTYSTDLFEPGTVRRMLGHLERVLEQVAPDADVRLSQLELLAAEEREQVLEAWNHTRRGYSDPPAHALFAEWARRAPKATALLGGREAVTYGALDRRAAVLARHLRDLGVGPETPVGLCLERTPELLVGVLGIWKAGGAYVPLDPSYPAERLGWIIADAALPVVVATGRTAGVLPEHGAALVRVDPLPETASETAGEAAPEVPASDASLAYVIYTSGSTGRPKGVLVQHGSLSNLLAATRQAFGVVEGDVMPALASYAFDIWLFEALLPLTSGAAVRLVERERVLDAHALVEEIADATLVHAVPALMRQVVRAERETPRLARLRRAFVGGDRVPADLLAEMREALPGADAHVLYGPTEGTILASTHPVPADGTVYGHPIGRPLGNVRLYVCDALGSPQPAGVPGELLIAGAGVARGYLGRAGLTAERFVPDPFGDEPGGRLYRTGDRARWRVDGVLEYLGRLDEQVKIRGFRIEPGEVEAVLSAHAEVREARVIVWEDARGEKRLAAYVVGGVEADELREHLRRSLPEYMVPAAFVALEALPLTPNGKLDRKALPLPELASAEERYVAPRTPVEEVLAGIWAEVLRLERVGVTESFFELGGHSLLATRVVSRVRQVFAIELPLRALFEGPTVAELAGRVEEMRRAGLPVLPPVLPTERTGPLPLSFAQERLWFIDRLDPGSAVYNMPAAWRLAGALDEAALERSLGEVVRRHEALRTTFAEVDGSPVQVIAPFDGFALPVEDLSGLGEADREAALRRRAGEEARRAFDLSAGPLFSAALLRLGTDDHVLLLSMHHIVSDGWSMGVLFRELSALYEAYREGRESPLPELGVQYADYALWQREHLRDGVLEGELAYWRERLADAPALLELPTDRRRPAAQSFRGATERVQLGPEVLERLHALGRQEGATLYMVALGAFQALLSRYSGSEDVVVGSPVAGRGQSEVEELIGFFVNTLVLRTDLSGDPSFREVLGRVREVTLGAYEHQELPFERLVAELSPERSLSHAPLFQVAFTLNDTRATNGGLAGLSVQGVGTELEVAKFDLSLGLTAGTDGLRGGLTYSTDLWEAATMRRLVGHFTRLVEQAAADPDVRISRVTLLDEAERRQVVEEWNRTPVEYATTGACIHDLIAAQAERTPRALAVVCGEDALTYHELDARANRLARRLAGLGAGPEVRVGICLERSAGMVVAMLAVLKAGAVYLPLDPAYPADRLAYMLSDSGARVLVTRASLRGLLPVEDVRTVLVDADAAEVAAEPDVAPRPAVAPQNAAYVIYTSGSTGRPKGVVVTHANAANLLPRAVRTLGAEPGGAVLQMASMSFDASLLESFVALLSGAALHVADREVVLAPERLAALLRERQIGVLMGTPSLLDSLPEADFPALRTVGTGGERCPAETAARWSRGRRLVNLYGPTETTIYTTEHECAPDVADAPPIGRPVEGARVYVLDAWGEPAPVGVPGELYVAGEGVARGYLGRPALTAERFLPDPFPGEAGARAYRTGDRVRWLPTGELEYLGRLDEQVKVRGFRIELGEIEGALRRSEGVADCVVVAREDVPGEKRLVAYVVGDVEAGGVRERLRRELPEYMVPAAFVPLERLPLTANGKLDRRALPAPEYAADADRYVAPRTPAEEVLAEIWGETLRLERVGVTESFFELGGHSLLATRVVSRVRQVFGVEVPLRALFEGPTVAELAGRVEEIRRAGAPALPPVVPAERTRALPLSFAQERLWFLDRLEPGSTTYNIPVGWRLGGALDAAALERALGEVVRRHEALRTVFAEVDGSPVQVIAPFAGFALPVEDLSGLGEADREAAVRGRAGEEARRAFDLSAGPLFRAALLRLGKEDHVLLLSMHHVVSDGWSMGVLFRELSALYAAYREGRESPLPELAVQYADYAVWQREQLEGEVLDRQLAYWREQLSGAPELLELPTDHPRPAVQTYRGAAVPVELSPELLERLQALGRSEGATLYMTLLSAFQVLLGKYAGSEDVVVGSPIAGRTRGEVEALIGFFVNTLVLRTGLSGDPPFREVLRRVREATLGAYEHQEVPFEKLVAELQPERSLSHSPLFQVMFALQNNEGRGGALAGLEVSGAGPATEIARFDLSLTLAATPQGLRGGLNYSTDLFERGTVDRMLGHLARVLEQVAADASVRLSRLDLLGEAERALLLEEWNRTEAEYPADRCIHELIEVQAARTPDAVAIEFEGETLSYRALNERANRLAHYLRRRGVGPEVRVGICLERSLEMVVSLLAVLKAGGAYVPLDPGYPAGRLETMAADAGIALLLTVESLRDAVPAPAGLRVVSVDAAWPAIAAESTENPESGAGPDTLAYVIYTSGSTGRPKGVMNQHRGVVNRLWWMQAEYGIGVDDVVLQKTPFSFDVSVWEFFWPLRQGATLVMARPDGHRDPLYLQEVIERRGVTTLHFVPSMLQQFVETAEAARCTTLRRVLCSGEALPPALVRRFYDRFAGPVVLANLYGPTEAAVDVSYWACAREDAAGVVPIGRPVWNTRLYVLDAWLKPVPVGVPGELYIGGVQVARGYQGRPGLTAERFIPNPFSADPGGRLYRTGDRARWRADGAIEYLGRLDHQVKVRGFRIELGEIEAVLRRHESVADCVVMARADAAEQRLVAYVVGGVEAVALRAHLRQSLPEYMVPAAFVSMDALPLTPNGKLDRKALPAPELASAEDRYVAPRNAVEEVLAGIWAEVLRLERVGVEESFFDLGGHSLLATRVVSRVRELFGVELPLRALFEGPTVAELAGRVEEMRRAGLPVLPAVVPTGRTGALPLSFAQERLWFIDRLEPGSATYNIPAALRLTGALDAAALERALGEIVRRHEALRTVFREVDGSPVQVIAPFGGFALPVEHLSGFGEAEREAAVRRRAREEAARPFDLSAGPLFRAALLRLGAQDHVLLLSMHHVVSDGWSMGVLFREMSALYAAYREGRESPLPGLPVQYADYAAWQREHLRGEVLERQLSYWSERLADAPALLELPTDHPRPAVQTHRGATVPVELSPELLQRLQALGRSEGATLYMTLLGAFQVLLSKYGGSEDVVVGSPIAGRTRKEVEELIGFFVNTLVMRTDLSGDPPFREVLRRVREATLGAYEHQELPFEKLVTELQPERSLSHSPLFQVMFTVQDAGGGGGALPGLEVSGVGGELASAKFDLSLVLAATSRGLRGGLTYRTDLFEPGTIEHMVRYLERVLEQVAADADVPLSRVDLLGEAERARVVEECNRTAAAYPADRCIHEWFQAQAARTPGAVAVTLGAESVTYAELEARANRLARHLLRRGARPDSLVGLLVERSVETVVGILGVLKAGAGYLPLDPADPDDRLAWVLQDSGAPIVVTTSALASRLAGGGAEIVRLGSEKAESPEAPAAGVAPGSLAYVIYTSGSTGRPKGVQVTHANVVRLFAATDAWFGFGGEDVWTLFHSYAFDFSVWEIWGALLYGGRLVVVPFQVSRSPEELYALLEAERVTVLNQTPSAFRQLMRADEEAAERGEARELALRTVVFGGEALDPAILRGWVDRRGDDRPVLVNMYGITETTVHVTYRVIREADVRGGSSSPIGVPIPDLSVHLLDRSGQIVPVGMVGEMYVGGGGVARGYLHRPELTAERFVRDPFSAGPAARLYRSGDLARRRVDGSLEFMGRADDQVKVRGFRIELREIQSVLLDHPAVRETVVLTRGEGEAKRLVAWIVAAGEVGAAELRAHLLAHLPGHMVPSAFVRLDALPLTRNGKVDRRALPEPDAGDLAGTRFVAPGTPTEEVLAALWAQLLGAGRVGATDDFFTLGGHSLLATRLASRVRSDLRVELPIRAVFEHSTLGALAAEVDRLRRAPPGVEAPPIVPVPHDGDVPLSLAQERLWFVDRMEPGSATYHMPRFVRLEGELDPDALHRALDELVRRHESLRTSFPLVDGAPVQRVAPPAPAELDFHDLSALRGDEREDEAARLVREQARIPFWLETGPLFRAALVKLEEGNHLLLTTLHHAIADGWSLDVLWHELAALYGAFSRGEASPLPEPRIQYRDFSVWQRAWLRGEVLERQVAFWRRTLEGAPPLLALPADRPRPPVQTHSGALERAFLPREVADAVLALARQEGATLFMVLLAALDLVLSRQSAQEDVVVGTPIAGRTRAETDRVVGLFLNSLALRVSLAGDPAFGELLRRVRDTTLDAYAHQDAPFEAVLEAIQPERSQDRTPVFQVMLNLANFAGAGEVTAAAPSGFAGLRVHGIDGGAGVPGAKFDLTLYAGERPDGIVLQLVYNPDLFDAGRMAALLAQLVAVLEQALEDPGRPVSRFVLADGRAPSGADHELRTAAGLPAGVGEPGEVWARRDGRWTATGRRGRYLPDGSIAVASSAPEPEAQAGPAAPEAGAAPTDTEREMLAIWSEVLDEPVELHDDFFDLGGHSLLGVRLLALVKKRLGRTLALPVLFGASTPAALAARVDDTGEGRGFVHLVPMGGETGALPPVYLVHPAGGIIFKYADLARHLGPGRPVYAIQAAGATDGAEPLRTVDLMAQRYLDEVLRLQPHGPYYLAGWSAGGVIAVEMAHRLLAAGHEVALTALLDSSPPNAEKPIPDPVHLYRRLAAGLSSAEPAELDALEAEIRKLPIDDRLPYLARWLGAHGGESRVHELDGLKPVVEVFRANVTATRRHPLAPYPGRVTLLCAEEGRGEGWEKVGLPELWKPYVTGELEVVVVPGTHISMVNEPNVREVAAAIQAAMARSCSPG